ncbi:hypothetical protein RRG08_029089 [Elysia crispata]|uniref:G-protein coupled receptors family 1 profile domain-containing protein n=1 Tax=Elysia crispata TaxID=231223 RepID=A0AAE0ZR05_9GAST|nr:hypothetical protein RRG08_029089 [Elysia crispata]
MWNISETDAALTNGTALVHQFMSLSLRNLFLMVHGGILLFLATCGLQTNVLNILIFRKLGLASSINISFLALSAADLACTCSYAFMAVMMLDMSGLIRLPTNLAALQYPLTPVQRGLTAFGSWVTAIISFERCCYVAFPMKAKLFFTRKLNICLIVGMFIVQTVTITSNLVFIRMTIYKSALSDRPRIVVDNSASEKSLYVILLFWAASFPNFICFTVIVASTAFLGISLKQRGKWLQSLPGPRYEETERNKRVVKTVVAISAIYITCFLPGVLVILVLFAAPSIGLPDPQTDLTFILTIFVRNFEALSVMTNIFVYFKMNSKFNRCLKILMCFACSQIRTRFLSD